MHLWSLHVLPDKDLRSFHLSKLHSGCVWHFNIIYICYLTIGWNNQDSVTPPFYKNVLILIKVSIFQSHFQQKVVCFVCFETKLCFALGFYMFRVRKTDDRWAPPDFSPVTLRCPCMSQTEIFYWNTYWMWFLHEFLFIKHLFGKPSQAMHSLYI